jgi:small-conductance mechanosensitive channel
MEVSFDKKKQIMIKDYTDQLMQKDVLIEELRDTIEELNRVTSDTGSKLKASIEAINEKRKAEELRISQQTTIKQLNEQNKDHIEKTLIAESKIKTYLHEMEEHKRLLE